MFTTVFDMRGSVGANELQQMLNNHGYLVTDQEFSFTKDNAAVKYLGYVDGKHRYLVAMEDDQAADDEKYIITTIHVFLGSTQMVAEYGAMPRAMFADPDECLEAFEKICN